MPISAPESTPRRSTEERQQEIVLTVLALAAERGVEAITTQAIAERMGLTQGAVFRHFPNKEAIWAAVLDWLIAQMESLFRSAQGQPPLVALEWVFGAYMQFFVKHPSAPRLFFSDTFHHPYPHLHERFQGMVLGCEERLTGLLTSAVKNGDLPPLSETVAAKLLLATLHGVAFQTCVLGIVADPVAIGRQLFPLYLAAIGATERV